MNISRLLFGLAASVSLFATQARADFTVTGTFMYQDRAFTYGGGFTGSEPDLPIRLAKVQVINAASGAVLASGATSETGQVSIFVLGSGTKDILVRCFAESNAFGPNSLRATSGSSATYSVSSSTFAGHNQAVDLDVGTVKALKLTSGSYQGNPFNMLDQMVWGMQYIKASGGSNPSQSMRMKWPGGSGSFASGTVATMANDDGYDDTVQLHEFGHVIHNVYSDSDSPGGSHNFAQSDQDPRLSFGEGWASFFAGAVRQYAGLFDPGFYLDADGKGGTGSSTVQLHMRFENGAPYAGSTGGEADEGAVFCALWDLIDRKDTNDTSANSDDDALDGSLTFVGLSADAAHWQTFIGPVKSASDLTIRDLWDGLFVPTNYGNQPQLEDAFDAWKIRFYEDSNEPNQSAASATPIISTSNFGATQTLYYSSSPAGAPGAGDSDYFSFSLNAGTNFEVETRYPAGKSDAETYIDPRIEVRRPDGTLFASDDDSGMGRNALLTGLSADTTGTWTVRVFSTHAYRKTGSYQLRMKITGGSGSLLSISSVTPSQVDAVAVDGGTQVTVHGSGLQVVTGVVVDGVQLASFPPTYTIVDDATLVFTMPLASSLGAIPIELQSPGGNDQTTIDVVANATPTIELTNSAPSFLIQALGLHMLVGGHPGDIAFVTASPELLPTPLPGLLDADLAIGNNFTSLFILATPVIGPAGFAELSIPVSGLLAGQSIHVQSAHLLLSTLFTPPAFVSNVQTGTVLF